jgi:competence protein ComEC
MIEGRIRAGIAVAGIVTSAAVAYALGVEWPGELQISVLDVGQGDALYIRTPDGADLLIDGGPNDSVGRALGQAMPAYDRAIDVVMATHSDLDHIGGLISLVDRYDIGLFIVSHSTSTDPARQALDQALARRSVPIVRVAAGDRINLDPANGVYLDVLWPPGPIGTSSEAIPVLPEDDNERSIVARLVYASTSVMLTGDAGEPTENMLVSKYGTALDSDVLKVGHHGSNTSTSDAFVGFVSPTTALISAGKDNQFGHPHQDVVDRLLAHGAETFQTKNEGLITLVSDGASFRRLR